MSASLDEIIANFDLLDEWDDRYRYLIELGKSLEPLPEEAHNEANKVLCQFLRQVLGEVRLMRTQN